MFLIAWCSPSRITIHNFSSIFWFSFSNYLALSQLLPAPTPTTIIIATIMATPSNHPSAGWVARPIPRDTIAATMRTRMTKSQSCSQISRSKLFCGRTMGMLSPKDCFRDSSSSTHLLIPTLGSHFRSFSNPDVPPNSSAKTFLLVPSWIFSISKRSRNFSGVIPWKSEESLNSFF